MQSPAEIRRIDGEDRSTFIDITPGIDTLKDKMDVHYQDQSFIASMPYKRSR